MNPQTQTVNLSGMTSEQLTNLLAQATAQVEANQAQQALVIANAKVQADNLATQLVKLQANVAAIQAAMAIPPSNATPAE